MKKNNTILILGTIFVFAVILIGGVLAYFTQKFGTNASEKLTSFANFGDFIGGTLNPILAFLGLIALLYTIKLQSDELTATRKELKKTVNAQKKQAKSLKLQNKATKLQIFENTFFQLNSLWINTRKSLKIIRKNIVNNTGHSDGGGGEQIVIKGINENDLAIYPFSFEVDDYEVVSYYLNIFKNRYSNYNDFNKIYEVYTGSYFGQLYQVLKFIDSSKIEDKQRYINIFRAQFSKDELEFLFYHCLGIIGKRKFKKLVEKYEFFEHITHIEKKEDISKPLSEYEISAYGKNEALRKMHVDHKNKKKDKYWNESFDV